MAPRSQTPKSFNIFYTVNFLANSILLFNQPTLYNKYLHWDLNFFSVFLCKHGGYLTRILQQLYQILQWHKFEHRIKKHLHTWSMKMLAPSRGEQKNRLNRENREKNNRKNRTEKKPIKIFVKIFGSVRFRFQKPETGKTPTEPNRFGLRGTIV